MTSTTSTYVDLVAQSSAAHERLFLQYAGPRDDFDIVIVGSGMGGGVLADAVAECVGDRKRILALAAGSFPFPTHVYNCCRFPNAAPAGHFGCDTSWRGGGAGSQNHIGEKPQLAFGGRSIFWSDATGTLRMP